MNVIFLGFNIILKLKMSLYFLFNNKCEDWRIKKIKILLLIIEYNF